MFREHYKDRNRRTRQAGKWYVEIPDPNGIPVLAPGLSRLGTVELRRRIERFFDLREACEQQDHAGLDETASMAHPAVVAQILPLTDQLRAAVRGASVTRYRLSQELGIDQAALSRFVNGERGLSLEAIDKLAAYLGLRLVGPRTKKGRKS